MTVREWLRRPSSLLLLLGIGVSAVGAFTLAWSVPSSGPAVDSMSYEVGYSNVTAWAALLAGCAIAFAAGRAGRRAGAEQEGHLGEAASPGRVGRGHVVALTALTAAVCVVFSYATYGFPVLEGPFFFDRMALALGGAVPWRDFGFPYGPLMLYVPVAVAWVAERLAGQPALGYYIFLVASQTAGVPLLAWVLGRLPLPRARRTALFWVLGSTALVGAIGGPNYSMVRFLVPIVGVLLLADLARPDRGVRPALLGLASVGIALSCAAVSPEMAVAYVAAATVVLWPRRAETGTAGRRPPVTALAVQSAVFALITVVAWGVLESSIGSFLGGAFALPLLPSPFVLMYGGMALAAAYAVGSGRLTLSGDAPTGLAVVVGLALVPSALGRADLGHVFFNGLGLMLGCAVIFHSSSRRRFWVWLAALALVFTGWTAYFYSQHTTGLLTATLMADVAPRSVTRWLIDRVAPAMSEAAGDAYGDKAPEGTWTTAEDRERLTSLDHVVMPFGMTDTVGLELAVRGRLEPMHADEKGPVDARSLEAAVRDLEDAEWVLIPVIQLSGLDAATMRSGAYEPGTLEQSGPLVITLLQFPAHLPVRHEPFYGRAALTQEVIDRFVQRGVTGRYLVAERRR